MNTQQSEEDPDYFYCVVPGQTFTLLGDIPEDVEGVSHDTVLLLNDSLNVCREDGTPLPECAQNVFHQDPMFEIKILD